MEYIAEEIGGTPVQPGNINRAVNRLRGVILFALAWVVLVVTLPDFIMGLLKYDSEIVHSLCDISGVIVLGGALFYLLLAIRQERRVTRLLMTGLGFLLLCQIIRIARVLGLLEWLHGTQSKDWYNVVQAVDEAFNGLGLVLIAAAFLTAIVDLFATKHSLTEQQKELSREMSRRAQIENEVLEERQKYKEMVNNLPIAVYRNTPGPEGRFLEMNAAHIAMLDADSEDELLRCRVSDFYKNSDKRKEVADKLLEQGFIRNEEVELVTLRGRRIWGSVTAVLKHDHDGQPYFDGVIEDITSRVNAENLLAEHRTKMIENARLASLGIMAGGIAHEINNPLAVIAGCVEQLEASGPDTPENDELARRLLALIRDNTYRIQKTIQGLRSLSRDASGDPFVEHPLAGIFENTVELCQQRFRVNGVRLEVCSPDPALTIECRPAQVAQILINLLNNAFDAVRNSPEKWVKLTAVASEGQVEIAVEDSGPGFPPEVADRLFVPFFTTKSEKEGLGLGLSISHAIVAAHGGDMAADTLSGHTRFVFRLPRLHQASVG